MMMRPDLLVLLVDVMVVAAIAVWALPARRRPAAAAELYRSFGLGPAHDRVLGADVGGFAVPT